MQTYRQGYAWRVCALCGWGRDRHMWDNGGACPVIPADGDEVFNGFAENRCAHAVLTAEGSNAFDAVEIQGCREHDKGTPDAYVTPDDESPEFFSVYLHYVPTDDNGGVTCVADFATVERARDYAAIIAARYDWPVYDVTRKAAHAA